MSLPVRLDSNGHHLPTKHKEKVSAFRTTFRTTFRTICKYIMSSTCYNGIISVGGHRFRSFRGSNPN